MDQATEKSDLKAAQGAGKHAVEKLREAFDWPPVVGVILLIVGRLVDRWLVARYSLSLLGNILLSVVTIFLAALAIVVIERRTKRARRVEGIGSATTCL